MKEIPSIEPDHSLTMTNPTGQHSESPMHKHNFLKVPCTNKMPNQIQWINMLEETTKQYSRNKKNFRKLNPSSSSFFTYNKHISVCIAKSLAFHAQGCYKKHQIHLEITDLETNDIQR